MTPIGRVFCLKTSAAPTTVPSATELKLRLVLLGFWPRAFEDFFLERRRVIVRALGAGNQTSRQGVIYEQETSQASQEHDAKRGANR